MKPRRVRVRWIDSHSPSDTEWTRRKKSVYREFLTFDEIETVAHLVYEDEKFYLLAHSVSEFEVCGRIAIPKVAVTKLEKL